MKRTPGRANPPEMPTGVPSARQQAAPVISPSGANEMAFMPPATCGTRRIAWPRLSSAAAVSVD